jgi:hypothetical protein
MNPTLTTSAGNYRWHENWVSVPRLETRPENSRTHGVTIPRTGLRTATLIVTGNAFNITQSILLVGTGNQTATVRQE